MSVSAAVVRELIAAGITGDALVSALERIEASEPKPNKVRSAAASRMAKYRDNRRDLGLSPYFNGADYRPKLIERDGDCCVYCGASNPAAIDHMYPISLGGTDHIDNLALACSACNGGKAGRTPSQARLIFISSSAERAHVRYVREQVRPEQHGEQRPNNSEQVRPLARVEDNLPTIEGPCRTDDDDLRARNSDWTGDGLRVLEGRLREAAGLALNVAEPKLCIVAPIVGLLTPGDGPACDLDLDVLPAVAAVSARAKPGSIRNWSYFRTAITTARDERLSGAPAQGTVVDFPKAQGPPRGYAAVEAEQAAIRAQVRKELLEGR